MIYSGCFCWTWQLMLLFSPECCSFHQNVAWSETLAKRSHHNMRTQQQMKAGLVQSRTKVADRALWYSKQTISSPHHFSRLCWVQTSSHIDHCLLSTHNTEPITSHVHIFTLPAVLVCFCICMTHFHPTYFYLEESVFLYNLCKAPRMYWKERLKGCGIIRGCVE